MKKIIKGILLVIGGLFLIGLISTIVIVSNSDYIPPPVVPKIVSEVKPEITDTIALEATEPKGIWTHWKEHMGVSDYDNECFRLKLQYIQRNMNDPESYEHVETIYKFNADTSRITVKTKIRGKNAFGAKVLATYVAVFDTAGYLISIKQL